MRALRPRALPFSLLAARGERSCACSSLRRKNGREFRNAHNDEDVGRRRAARVAPQTAPHEAAQLTRAAPPAREPSLRRIAAA
jgi:hypothetical protein